MMIHVANPIYDSVFKYLIEDERIARTLLSALLKKEVVEVHVRRHDTRTALATRSRCSVSISGRRSGKRTAAAI